MSISDFGNNKERSRVELLWKITHIMAECCTRRQQHLHLSGSGHHLNIQLASPSSAATYFFNVVLCDMNRCIDLVATRLQYRFLMILNTRINYLILKCTSLSGSPNQLGAGYVLGVICAHLNFATAWFAEIRQ